MELYPEEYDMCGIVPKHCTDSNGIWSHWYRYYTCVYHEIDELFFSPVMCSHFAMNSWHVYKTGHILEYLVTH